MIKSIITNVNYVLDCNSELSVKMERIGDWVWVSGDTRPIKEELKTLGFFWGNKKKAWYFKGKDTKRGTTGFYANMDNLRLAKGSESLR
jgi:hypothetical protein